MRPSSVEVASASLIFLRQRTSIDSKRAAETSLVLAERSICLLKIKRNFCRWNPGWFGRRSQCPHADTGIFFRRVPRR